MCVADNRIIKLFQASNPSFVKWIFSELNYIIFFDELGITMKKQIPLFIFLFVTQILFSQNQYAWLQK